MFSSLFDVLNFKGIKNSLSTFLFYNFNFPFEKFPIFLIPKKLRCLMKQNDLEATEVFQMKKRNFFI